MRLKSPEDQRFFIVNLPDDAADAEEDEKDAAAEAELHRIGNIDSESPAGGDQKKPQRDDRKADVEAEGARKRNADRGSSRSGRDEREASSKQDREKARSPDPSDDDP